MVVMGICEFSTLFGGLSILEHGGGPAAWLLQSSVYPCFPNFQSKKNPMYYISNDLFCLLQMQRDCIQQLGLCGVFLQCIIYLVDVLENCECKN